MKKFLKSVLAVMVIAMVFTSCSTSYTTVATPKSTNNKMVVTSGDMPNKNYEVLGFVQSTATEMGFGIPTETKMSAMKSEALNNGLVTKGESLGADAIINVQFSSYSTATYFFFLTTNVYVAGTAIKFK
jgi:PBP1b-binding outer membrane lipoprotein LpoB